MPGQELNRELRRQADERWRMKNIPEQQFTVTETSSTGTAGTVQTDEDTRDHIASSTNPHSVTAAQVGAIASVDGVSNDGGDVDLIAGNNITVTPSNTSDNITISGTSDIPDVGASKGDIAVFTGSSWANLAAGTSGNQLTVAATAPTGLTWADPGGSTAAGVDTLSASTSTGMTGNIELVGGTNVTLTQDGSTKQITINATGGGGGSGLSKSEVIALTRRVGV